MNLNSRNGMTEKITSATPLNRSTIEMGIHPRNLFRKQSCYSHRIPQEIESDSIQLQSPKSFDQFCQAFRLTYHSYLEAGLIEANGIEMRFSVLQLLSNSWTMVAIRNQQVISTGTVIANGPAGLPMGSLFHRELESLISSGRFLVEGTMFASEKSSSLSVFKIALKLLQEGIRGAFLGGADDWLSVVHPHHVSLYVQKLGFQILAEKESCSHVCHKPGVLLRLDLRSLRQKKQKATPMVQREVLNCTKVPEGFSHPYRFREEEALALMLLQPQLMFDLSAQQRDELRKEFPMALQIAESKLR
jgi:hypothetical protein